jgi:hypothetical protein
MGSTHRLSALISFLVIGLCRTAEALSIGRSGFSAAAKVEGFEGIVNGTNLAIQTPYIFPSGVSLTGPVPSISGTFGPYIVGDGFFGLLGGQDVPDGAAYLGQAAPDNRTGPLVFTFPTPVYRAGAYICIAVPPSTPNASVIMEALNSAGQVLESATISDISPAEWSSDFVGIQNSGMIAQLEFVGDESGVLRIDDLTFEVPEPSSLAILTSGLFLLSQRRRHK